MSEDIPETIHELETPCLLVDIDIVRRNCQKMIDTCKEYGVELRPHMKTHKTIEGGELMTNSTKRKIVVSTVDEAWFYAKNGFDDILWASPIVKPRISKRVIELANTKEFHVFFDSLEGLQALIDQPLNKDRKWSVFLEIDCGYGRTGCLYDSEIAVQLAKMASDSDQIEFQGLYVHCGNTYQQDVTKKKETQKQTTERLLELKDRLEKEGVSVKTYGCGSTPSCTKPQDFMKHLTEFHPGNYIFNDFMQIVVGSCSFEDIACRVMTTVIDHKPTSNTVVVDCGWTAISMDWPEEKFVDKTEVTTIQDHPELYMAGMTQELGKLKANQGQLDYSKYPLGTRLFVYPYDASATSSKHPVFYIHSGDKIIGAWKPTRGW